MSLIQLLLRKSWHTLAVTILTSLVSGASSTGLIAMTNKVLNSGKLGEVEVVGSFIYLCLLMLIANILSQVLIAKFSQSTIFDMRVQISRRILASPLQQLEMIGGHRLLATLTNDVQSVSTALSGLPSLCTNLAIVICCLFYLSMLSLSVFLIVVGSMALGILSLQVIIARGRNLFKLAREEQDQLFNHFRAIVNGIKELKLNSTRRQTFFYDDLVATGVKYREHMISGATYFAMASSFGLLTLFTTIGILLFVIPRLVEITPSILSGYALVLIYIVIPLNSVLNFSPVLSKAKIALDKVESLGLALVPQANEMSFSDLRNKQFSSNSIRLSEVTHDYGWEKDGSGFMLGPLSLFVKPGELIFIIGGNGSGKSTLAKLLTGLYEPKSGQIYFGTECINTENRDSYRQFFSTVFSDFYLFERLIGLEDPNCEQQVNEYLIRLQLDHKVKICDGKLSTTALSQGQRKRLALLNAYLEDRSVYLFDEWAADQDPIFKDVFYTQLLPELQGKGKTVLVISHDDRYFHIADRVIRLEEGRLKENIKV
ncbi:cyclic peptide export ABC transporter [Mastigocoleus testarum]|uniref:ABC transporter ATP-binding protein n=1 Tax=Mastigocoleus testarum BC008 TaxID=371196 RepID=A0A0V8A162_9CYAN|nr:cyclic peptide export ABC transporter [Mastigocoleus testarum]KST70367.1 ABC transporter ATP-binding protein [Mastigocoleus testarum BC008]